MAAIPEDFFICTDAAVREFEPRNANVRIPSMNPSDRPANCNRRTLGRSPFVSADRLVHCSSSIAAARPSGVERQQRFHRCQSSTRRSWPAKNRVRSIGAGTRLILSVGASGTPPLSYQWSRKWPADSERDRHELHPAVRLASDEGFYTVTVSNSAGATVSNTASIQVYTPPRSGFLRRAVYYRVAVFFWGIAASADQLVAVGLAASFSRRLMAGRGQRAIPGPPSGSWQ